MLISLIIREMQIETLRYHLISISMSKIKIQIVSSVEDAELSYTAGENATWYNQFRKQFGSFIKS